MKENILNPEKIKIHYVKIYKSNNNVSNQYLENPIKPSGFKFGFSQETASNIEENQMRVRLNIDLKGMNEDELEIGITAEYGIEFQVEVDNMEDYYEVKDNNPHFSSLFGSTIMGILYSTARGIIIERTQSTYFSGVILPVINPNILLNSVVEK